MARDDDSGCGCCGCLVFLVGALVISNCTHNYIDRQVREKVDEVQSKPVVVNHFYNVSTNGVPVEEVIPYRQNVF
jgi:hypothetical protein